MESIYKCAATCLIVLCMACASSRSNRTATDTLQASSLKPYGRYILNNQHLELISSAVHTGFSFQGRECRVYVSLPNAAAHNYLQYEMDGMYQKNIRISGDTVKPLLLTAQTDGTHTVWLYKTTEAHTGAILIHKITGRNVRTVQKPPAPVIEFIGNSITCGAAADSSQTPCNVGSYHDHHNAYQAYGPRVARALGAEFVLSSVSGIGVYRNWNSDGPTMPQVYEKTDLQANSTARWDFDQFRPAVVSIALGTNDFSNGDGIKKRLPFDSAAFISNYVSFVERVAKIHPRAQIALLSSPMLRGRSMLTLQNCLTAVKQQADSMHVSVKPIALHFFQPMQAHGCGGHPDVEDHAVMARELVPFFKTLLGK